MCDCGTNSRPARTATRVPVAGRGGHRWLAAALAVLLLGVVLAACQMSVAGTDANTDESPTEPELTAPPTVEQPDGPPATPTGGERATVTVEPAALTVAEGGAATYQVMLGSQPTGAVTVTPQAPAKLALQPDELTFTPDNWRAPQSVTVAAARDSDAVADAAVQVTHTARGGGYDDATATVSVTIVEVDIATLAVAATQAAEHAGGLSFMVTLSRAADRVVSAHFATGDADDSASDISDYAPATGTLRFPARSTGVQTIEVVVLDDALDEDDEVMTVTLSNASVPLAGGGATLTATGTIKDDDPPPQLSIADAAVTEDDGAMGFEVRLEPASGRAVVVDYATADATATAGADYTAQRGMLTFPAGATMLSIAVPIAHDQNSEQTETFTVTLTVSDPERATLSRATATGTITDQDPLPPLELESLQVFAPLGMYPAFDAGIHHYTLTCRNDPTLRVTATAKRSGASLTLLRANPDDNHHAVGNLDAWVSVNGFHDIAIELNDGGETTMYVVHCRPDDFTGVKILKKLDGASEGFLFVTPRGSIVGKYGALIDYDGLPRRIIHGERVFRPFPNGPTIDDRQVRYGTHTQLLDEEFKLIRNLNVVAPLIGADDHDFLVTDRGFLFISYHNTIRDLSAYQDNAGNPLPSAARIRDSVIQEVTLGSAELFHWNSWDHLAVESDCLFVKKYLGDRFEYAHLNSLQIVDGDIIASFRGCSQVLRIDRSSGTGAVEWKLGGTAPDPDSTPTYTYLPLVGDPAGEFCGQHQATLTAAETVVMFDNGVQCLGPRKDLDPFSRVVEYDISSGTQATFLREYPLPDGQGYSISHGGVTVLNADDTDRNNDRWLIAWGFVVHATVGVRERIAISEVDPVTGTSLFELSMFSHGLPVYTYRVHHQPETAVTIPLNLP